MHQFDEKNFPDENRDEAAESQNPGRSTGPRTPAGKANSSMNRLTHGCRSEILLLPFEDPAEFEFMLQSWMQAYNPQAHRPFDGRCARLDEDDTPFAGGCARLDEDPTASTLVYETAKAHWFFQRNQKRLHQIEVRLPSDAWQWTDENIKLFNNFSRYKTAAERSFYRAFNNLEAHYKRQHDRAAKVEKANAQMAKIELQWLKNKQESATQDKMTLQYVDVMGNDCDTTTTWLPTNETILKMVENTGKTPEFVNRYLFFWNGVPPEYEWTNPTHIQREHSSIGIQRMFYSDWLKLIEDEKSTGHIQPRETVLARSRQQHAPAK